MAAAIAASILDVVLLSESVEAPAEDGSTVLLLIVEVNMDDLNCSCRVRDSCMERENKAIGKNGTSYIGGRWYFDCRT